MRTFSGQRQADKSKALGRQSLKHLTSKANVQAGIAGHSVEFGVKDYGTGAAAKGLSNVETLHSHFPLKPSLSCQTIHTSLPGRHARPLQLETESRWCVSKILKTSSKLGTLPGSSAEPRAETQPDSPGRLKDPHASGVAGSHPQTWRTWTDGKR